MDPAHRFSTPEIEEVFARAAAAQARDREADLGLSMEELQAVGAEAGLDPVQVAAAARAVAEGEPDEGRESLLGIPVGVRRSATLEAAPSDAMWETLVADLQDTFSARGKLGRIGAAQTWHNGNLRATLSPSGDSARLRLQTNRRSDTSNLILASAVNAALAVYFAITSSGNPLVLSIIAIGLAALVIVRQTTWARTRERQMDAVAARAQRTARALESQPPTTSRTSAPILDLVDLEDDAEPGERVHPRGRTRS